MAIRHSDTVRISHRGFTLTELLVVMGLIAVLISLLFPVLGKARADAESATCLSNLRQMGAGWAMYISENRGRLPEFIRQTPATPEIAWRGYWPGILDSYNIRGDVLLCPSAGQPIPFNQPMPHRGFGNLRHAWTGRFQNNGTVARFNATTFRDSSYGYNRYLTAGGTSTGGFGVNGSASRVAAVRPLGEVPVFFDSVFLDCEPINGSVDAPVPAPPNLRWDNVPTTAPEHWRFLISRHGRGIQVCMGDGSVQWVPLEETYLLTWKTGWQKYRLTLPHF